MSCISEWKYCELRGLLTDTFWILELFFWVLLDWNAINLLKISDFSRKRDSSRENVSNGNLKRKYLRNTESQSFFSVRVHRYCMVENLWSEWTYHQETEEVHFRVEVWLFWNYFDLKPFHVFHRFSWLSVRKSYLNFQEPNRVCENKILEGGPFVILTLAFEK